MPEAQQTEGQVTLPDHWSHTESVIKGDRLAEWRDHPALDLQLSGRDGSLHMKHSITRFRRWHSRRRF